MEEHMLAEDEEKYKTVYNIDKENHPDDEIVRFSGKEFRLGDVRKFYEVFDERKYSLLSFWDDMFQYTSLGLLDLLLELHKINSPIPIRSFLTRKAIYGKQFVYNVMKRFKIDKEEIDAVEKKYYEEILKRSPISANSEGYFKLREICDRQLMVFKYDFSIIKTVSRIVQESFGRNEYISFETDFMGKRTEEEYLKFFSSRYPKFFDIVICQDAAAIIEYIDKCHILDTHILTPFEHCGLSNEVKYTIEAYTDGVGPNNCRLHYIKEKL
jgi:hypothetical protein